MSGHGRWGEQMPDDVDDEDGDDEIEDWMQALDDQFLTSLHSEGEIQQGLLRLKQEAALQAATVAHASGRSDQDDVTRSILAGETTSELTRLTGDDEARRRLYVRDEDKEASFPALPALGLRHLLQPPGPLQRRIRQVASALHILAAVLPIVILSSHPTSQLGWILTYGVGIGAGLAVSIMIRLKLERWLAQRPARSRSVPLSQRRRWWPALSTRQLRQWLWHGFEARFAESRFDAAIAEERADVMTAMNCELASEIVALRQSSALLKQELEVVKDGVRRLDPARHADSVFERRRMTSGPNILRSTSPLPSSPVRIAPLGGLTAFTPYSRRTDGRDASFPIGVNRRGRISVGPPRQRPYGSQRRSSSP